MSNDGKSDFGEALWERSSKLHKELADKFHLLTTAAAFGTLWYLLSLEQHLPPQDHQNPCALRTAWCAAYLSCVFGGVHLFLEMLLPLRAYNSAAIFQRERVDLGDDEATRRADSRANRYLLWGAPAWLHLAGFVAAFVAAGFYRFSNF